MSSGVGGGGGDSIAYLREKAVRNFKLKEQELKLRKEEHELNKQREKLLLAQSGAMIQLKQSYNQINKYIIINKLAEKF